MKKNPFSALIVALATTVVCVAGYALREDPAPTRTGADPLTAPILEQSKPALPDDPKPPASSSEGKEKDSLAAKAPAASARWSGQIQSAAPISSAQSQTASTHAYRDPSVGIQPEAEGLQFQPASPGTSTDLKTPPAPSATIPLVFQPLPAALAANPQLAAAVRGLQQSFVEAVGGQNQDSNSPAYHQRWNSAQYQSDEQYRLLVGNQAYLVEQIQVNGKQQ